MIMRRPRPAHLFLGLLLSLFFQASGVRASMPVLTNRVSLDNLKTFLNMGAVVNSPLASIQALRRLDLNASRGICMTLGAQMDEGFDHKLSAIAAVEKPKPEEVDDIIRRIDASYRSASLGAEALARTQVQKAQEALRRGNISGEEIRRIADILRPLAFFGGDISGQIQILDRLAADLLAQQGRKALDKAAAAITPRFVHDDHWFDEGRPEPMDSGWRRMDTVPEPPAARFPEILPPNPRMPSRPKWFQFSLRSFLLNATMATAAISWGWHAYALHRDLPAQISWGSLIQEDLRFLDEAITKENDPDNGLYQFVGGMFSLHEDIQDKTPGINHHWFSPRTMRDIYMIDGKKNPLTEEDLKEILRRYPGELKSRQDFEGFRVIADMRTMYLQARANMPGDQVLHRQYLRQIYSDFLKKIIGAYNPASGLDMEEFARNEEKAFAAAHSAGDGYKDFYVTAARAAIVAFLWACYLLRGFLRRGWIKLRHDKYALAGVLTMAITTFFLFLQWLNGWL